MPWKMADPKSRQDSFQGSWMVTLPVPVPVTAMGGQFESPLRLANGQLRLVHLGNVEFH